MVVNNGYDADRAVRVCPILDIRLDEPVADEFTDHLGTVCVFLFRNAGIKFLKESLTVGKIETDNCIR